jgi:5-methylcytosine-specific restriction endonuclease McrA
MNHEYNINGENDSLEEKNNVFDDKTGSLDEEAGSFDEEAGNLDNSISNLEEKSFFESFSVEEIFTDYTSCQSLLELAIKLGYKKPCLNRIDYEYINKIKTREIWLKYIKKGTFEQERNNYIRTISTNELVATMNMPGIRTVSHLATHFFLSQRHGRDILKNRIDELGLKDLVPDELYKGFYNESRTPWTYPKKQYEKQYGPKPETCIYCGFQASDPKQMEIHHQSPSDKQDPKQYVTTTDLEVVCANCHTLEHRVGDKLKASCGIWRRKPPEQLSYDHPDEMFSDDCPFDHTTQKRYFLKWHLKSENEYRCFKCGASNWGPQNKLLVLELNHIDGTRKNSLLNNLELLCPNCHRLVHTTAKKGQPKSTQPKPKLRRVFITVPDINSSND